MCICLAFAVNKNGKFGKNHFGDADKYLIYEYKCDEMNLIKKLPNRFKKADEKQKHGSCKKGESIVKYLKEHNVKSLVSKQFGKNIKIVNKHFVPVIIDKEHPKDAINVIIKHIDSIKNEALQDKSEYKVFYLREHFK